MIDSGKAALPAIREFLARNEDIDYESSLQPSLRAARDGKMQIDFVFPPSLRFGLLDVARQIGGTDAEKFLSDTLSATGRGAEVAYLARVLDQMAPGKYRETAVSIARDLLSNPPATGPGPGLDKYDQHFLFGVLTLFNDASFAQQAQARLVGADGALDVGALKYLQSTLAEQAVAIAANAYTDPRIDPAKKEPLARVALYYAGLDAKANAMFHQTISDPGLPLNVRRELVEDLNQDGISSEKNPTPQDQRVIAARLQLIESYHGAVTEPRIIAAFAEAKKDLLQMQSKALGSAPK